MEHIRVVLADDHPIVRSSIRSILNKSPDIEVIGEASSGAEALILVDRLEPDVLVLDVEMPEVHGIEVAQKLQEEKAELPILAVSAHEDRQFILGMLSSGARHDRASDPRSCPWSARMGQPQSGSPACDLAAAR
jgi:DNA-binding NarL/FixJ family response regulator